MAASVQEKTSLCLLLTSEVRDFLISPSGAQVKVEELTVDAVGLYFAANWYSHCQTFTPILTKIYNELRKNGARFEVVFVSSDEDHHSFDNFFGTMPWLAIPYADLPSKKSLTERFQIEGMPSLLILDSFGVLIHTEGLELIYRYGMAAFPFSRERVAELEAEEKAKHASQTLEKLLATHDRDYLNCNDKQELVSSMVGKTVGLYFSALWCQPCRQFTQKLAVVYNNLKARKEEFEIVFVSADRDKMSYAEYYKSMPWLALPYGDEASRALLRYFNVQGIPCLVIIGPDGKTVTKEGRNLVNLHQEMAFPFTEGQLRLIQDRLDEAAKRYSTVFRHAGHRHVLNLVSAATGGGPFICCECGEQGYGWAYLCIDCGYEIHPKCARGSREDDGKKDQVRTAEILCARE